MGAAGIEHIVGGLGDVVQLTGHSEAVRACPPGHGLHLLPREGLSGGDLLAKLQLLPELPVKVNTHTVAVFRKSEGRLVALW